MGISRAAQSSTSVHRNLGISRLRRHDINQVRCLWWWGKHSRGWWSSQDDLEERLRRHQALMMHRYTKAMKRRSLWDREHTPSPLGWRVGSCKTNRDMHSTDPARAKILDNLDKKAERQAWHEVHKDFDSFKRAIDRAIQKDPHGALFGRRLRSPDTANNSSWTSWSWIFDPKEIKQDPAPEPLKETGKPPVPNEKQSGVERREPLPTSTHSQASVSHSSSSNKTTTTIKSSQSIIFQDRSSMATEYIYDPISGRKIPQPPTPPPVTAVSPVPKETKALEAKKEEPKKSLVESLFTENGTSIPVKVYKPPKVYGFTGEATPKPKSDPSPAEKIGSSRKREFNELRWRTLGNNIDSTNFNCEPWNNKEVKSPTLLGEESVEKRSRTSPAPAENTALFSGTAYESKSMEHRPSLEDYQLALDHLEANDKAREETRFRFKQGMTMPSLKSNQPAPSRPSEPVTKIEPAMDRSSKPGLDIPVKKFTSKLEPAVDRVVDTSRLEPAMNRALAPRRSEETLQGAPILSLKQKLSKLRASRTEQDSTRQQDKREDIDLLRASDVRASTKSTRVTKEATENKKQQERSNLEQQFERNAVSDKANLESVWKHVKHYPNGIVAKTMQSLGLAESQEKSAVPSKVAPKFSEPTVKPGIIRDLQLENHTQVFEPQVANIVDRAKGIKRELHDVKLTLGDVINERAITAMANRDLIMKEVDPQQVVQKITEPLTTPTAERSIKTTPLPAAAPVKSLFSGQEPIMLVYLAINGEVTVVAADDTTSGSLASKPGFSPMAALGALSNPSAFVKHFAELDKNGFELVNGTHDRLVFHKKQKSPPISTSIRATVAANEAASQPVPQVVSKAKVEPLKAAEVLDQIPPTIPTPGPSAPTAPTSTRVRPSTDSVPKPAETPRKTQYVPIEPKTSSIESESQPALDSTQDSRNKSRKSRSRISRQEEVFSGQQRLKPQTTVLPDPEHFQKQTPYAQQQQYESPPRLGFFARLRRTIKRTILTALAFGAGAYGIGVLAEGLQAKAQIRYGENDGPMKRVVFEGEGKRLGDRQRAGIFSTESSR